MKRSIHIINSKQLTGVYYRFIFKTDSEVLARVKDKTMENNMVLTKDDMALQENKTLQFAMIYLLSL